MMHLMYRLTSTAAAAVVVAGCAGTPMPRAELASARTAIESALVAGADQHAPTEMNRARDKLMRAQIATRVDENEMARQLAREAQVEAQLAQARSAAARAKQAESAVTGSSPDALQR